MVVSNLEACILNDEHVNKCSDDKYHYTTNGDIEVCDKCIWGDEKKNK